MPQELTSKQLPQLAGDVLDIEARAVDSMRNRLDDDDNTLIGAMNIHDLFRAGIM